MGGDPVRVVARRRVGFAHEVEIEGRHRIAVDEPAEAGGSDSGPSPTRLLAASLASCIAITVEMYAERKAWDVGELEVAVDVAYDGHAPRSFEARLRLPPDLGPEEKERLLAIAAKCPVHKVIAGQTEVAVSERLEPA